MTAKLSFALSNNQTLPTGWKWSTLDGVSNVIAGNPAPQGTEFFLNGKYAFVRVQDMGRLGAATRLAETNDYINDKAVNKLKLFPKGSVLFTKSGASTLLNQRAILAKDMYVVSHIAAAIPKDGVKSEWLYYWMKSVDFNHLAHATTLPSLPLSKAKAIPVPLAPYNEQTLIVEEIEKQFSRLDEAVAALKRIKANLKRYKASVLKSAVEGKLTEEWRKKHSDVEPASELLKRILAERRKKWEKEHPGKKYREPAEPDTSNLHELPKGWVWATVGQISESMKNGIYKPLSSYADDGVACLRMYNIESGKIVWKNIKRMLLSEDEIEEYQLLPGDLLVNRVNSRELVGKAAPIPTGLEVCVFESKNIRVRFLTELINTIFISYIFTLTGQNFFNRNAQQVVGMASISQPQVSALPVPFPSLTEQNKIVEEVESRLSVTEVIEIQIDTNLKRAERLRQSILKKAFEGKLAV